MYHCFVDSVGSLEIYNEIHILEEEVFFAYVHIYEEQHMLFKVGRVRFYPVFS